MDFTFRKHEELLINLIKADYQFQTFKDFIVKPNNRTVILRHDVDLLPKNSLRFAKIQHDLGLKGVYYFRAVPESWDEKIILEIAKMGHEIGYHYENLTISNGKLDVAIHDFESNLKKLRDLVNVSTICMHGSPTSKFDSKDLWKHYSYLDYDIIGEPYFDIDFNKVFYLTDTGRMWDGHKYSVRDKVQSKYSQTYHSTNDILETLNKNLLPDQIMFTFHPQRWNDNYFMWTKEFFQQTIKNFIKKIFFVKKSFKIGLY